MRRTDVTVLASAEAQSIKNRLGKAYREEKDPERAAVIAVAIMHVDTVLSAILSINLYDESLARAR